MHEILIQSAIALIPVPVVRGFGTALMHGGATEILAAPSCLLFAPRLRVSEEKYRFSLLPFVPGLLAAILVYAVFNQFPNQALLAMAVMCVLVPVALFLIFLHGEQMAHHWLAIDSVAHARLAADIRSGAFAQGPDGAALVALANRPGPADGKALMDHVALNAELVARADRTSLAREEHAHVHLGSEVEDQFRRLRALERRLGSSVVHAVRKHLHISRDDLWKMHELEIDKRRHIEQ